MLWSHDPRSGERRGEPIAATTTAELDAVVHGAHAARAAWADATTAERADVLDAIAAALETAGADLVAVADAETALGKVRLRGEVARTTGQLRMFGDVLREGDYVAAMLSPANETRPDVRRMLHPIGPVAVFAASNFPFAFSVAGGDTASALAAGCPVVVKAHEGHPRTSALTARIVAAAAKVAGAPDGTFGIVYGVERGRDLVLNPGIRAVGFTGSTAGGRALFDLASGRPDPIPFFGELGSINPVVVLPGAAAARADQIANGFAGSLTLGGGQFCTNPGLVFVPAGDERLLTAIATAVAASSGGPMLTEKIHAGFERMTAASEWAHLPLIAEGSGDGPWAARPEVRRVPIAQFGTGPLTEERFGPAALLVTYDDVAALPAVLARLPGSLTASVHASDDELDAARPIAAALHEIAGRLIMNDWPTGVAVCWAMHHGGPWPASTSAARSSVGATAIERWLTPVAYQDWPDVLLPPALQDGNPLGINRVER
ncbi:MAG: aldehyde dehydrogenase (NADP(+)) [Actinomycetota bacterium]